MARKISTSRRKSDGKPRRLRKVRNTRSARRQARRLVEFRIGRKLKKKELVHHKDHKTTNNSSKNLKVIKGQKKHGRVHPGK